MRRIELPTSWTTIRRSNQLSYIRRTATALGKVYHMKLAVSWLRCKYAHTFLAAGAPTELHPPRRNRRLSFASDYIRKTSAYGYVPPLKILFSRLWLLGLKFWNGCNGNCK